MIEMHSSHMDGQPLATYQTRERMTIEAWLLANKATYADREPGSEHRLMVLVNGEQVPPAQWAHFEFGPDDHVRMHRVALGGGGGFLGGVMGGALKVLDVLSLGLLGALMGSLTPKMPSNRGQAQGDRLSEATLKTNIAKLNSPIRQVAGRNRIYPDIILPSRRYFASEREQKIDVLLCFGWGHLDLTPADLLISETRLLALGADQQSTIYGPGADLSGDPRAEWWHTAPEVGASSKGSPGLELRATYDVEPNLTGVSELTFNGDVIFIPTGAGEFPEGWTGGIVLRVEQYLNYEILGGMRIYGPVEQLDPFPGMLIEIEGDVDDLYRVGTYTPYSPPVPANPGAASTLTGSSAPATFDFDATPAAFNVVHDGSWPISLTADVVDMAGLVSALNAQLPARIRASDAGGVVMLTEQSPFIGQSITVGAGSSVVMGSSPTGVTGTQTTPAQPEVLPYITLTFDDGSPVTGLPNGIQRLAIGYRGMRYRITAGGETSIALERLTDTGAVDTEWGGFGLATTTDAVLTVDGSTMEGDWCGWFAVCPEGETVNRIEWDVFFGGGLTYINSKGRLRAHGVTIELQWREAGTTDPGQSISKDYVAATRDDIGFTEFVDVPNIRPEVRARRMSAKSSSTKVQDGVHWYGLRGRMNGAPTSYEGVTLAAITIAGGDRLAAQVERQISGIATRMLPPMEGGALVPTRDIAPWVKWVCNSLGYTDDDIDMEELWRLHGIWSARGDYYDDDIGDKTTVKEVLGDALGAGFASLTVQRGVICPVRDEPRTTPDGKFKFDPYAFSGQNYLAGGALVKSTEMFKPDDHDGVDIEYLDGVSHQWEIVQCRLPGDQGVRVLKQRVQGVKSRTQAWRIGMRLRREMRYCRTSFSWSTQQDLLNVGYLSFVTLTDDVPGYGQSALVESAWISGDRMIIESTEPLRWEEGAEHVVGLRRPDGTLSGPYPAEQVDEYHMQIPLPDFDPIQYVEAGDLEPTHIQFGTITNWSYQALVQEVSPNGPDQVSATAKNYDLRVYADDDNFPPA